MKFYQIAFFLFLAALNAHADGARNRARAAETNSSAIHAAPETRAGQAENAGMLMIAGVEGYYGLKFFLKMIKAPDLNYAQTAAGSLIALYMVLDASGRVVGMLADLPPELSPLLAYKNGTVPLEIYDPNYRRQSIFAGEKKYENIQTAVSILEIAAGTTGFGVLKIIQEKGGNALPIKIGSVLLLADGVLRMVANQSPGETPGFLPLATFVAGAASNFKTPPVKREEPAPAIHLAE